MGEIYKNYHLLNLVDLLNNEFNRSEGNNFQFTEKGLKQYISILSIYELNSIDGKFDWELFEEIYSKRNEIFNYSRNYVLNLLNNLNQFRQEKFDKILNSAYQIDFSEKSIDITPLLIDSYMLDFIDEEIISEITFNKLTHFAHQITIDLSNEYFQLISFDSMRNFKQDFESSGFKNFEHYVISKVEEKQDLVNQLNLQELELLVNSFSSQFREQKIGLHSSVRLGTYLQNSKFKEFNSTLLREAHENIINSIDLNQNRRRGFRR